MLFFVLVTAGKSVGSIHTLVSMLPYIKLRNDNRRGGILLSSELNTYLVPTQLLYAYLPNYFRWANHDKIEAGLKAGRD